MKLHAICLIGTLFIIALYSCDKVDGPYREEGSKGIVYINHVDSLTFNGDTIAFTTDNSTDIKKVLAEDYTGHLCGNCPYAGVYLNDTLKEMSYGDKLVVMSVHAGFFAYPCPHPSSPCPGAAAPAGSFATDFINPTSTDWDNFFGNSAAGNPNGMIDRISYPGGQVKTPGSWNALIQSESLLAPECRIRIKTRYNPTSREFGAAVQTKFLAEKSGTFKLEVAVLEDSIIDWQEWYLPHLPQFDSTYVHRNVLRGAINGSFAAAIANGDIANGTILLNGFSSVLNSSWDASHCKVVAFLYDASDYRVLQVEEASVSQ